MDSLVPSKTATMRHNQPWITKEVKRLSRRKQRAYTKAKRSGREQDWKRYKKLKKHCQEECRSAYNTYLTEMIAPDMDSHPKKFWSFIKSKHTDKCGNAPLKDEDGLTANQQLKLKSLTNSSALFLPVTIFRTTFRIKVQAHMIPWEGSQSLRMESTNFLLALRFIRQLAQMGYLVGSSKN